MGLFGKAVMQPEFTAAAFALEEGEMTPEPVITQSGVHLILRIAPDVDLDAPELRKWKATIGR